MSDENTHVTDEAELVRLTPDAEIHSRFQGGVNLAQRWGAGIGEYLPEGTVYDSETGELYVRRITPPAEEKPAEEVQPPAEEEPAKLEEPSEKDALLQRLAGYIERLRRM